ncbi:hypothetical protein [Litoreibacter roseus]|uniref:Sulfotransferase family protein n=1 Tax=Litoreibacter roseus TaxID=2601869 RepID=A0A6N6JF95_9RHOB|nr:hypothetical protein [Litoreibacter roseus]GFE64896.1 hypothetical protein KIN_19700 [Litoreibacter roseus]
MNAASEGGTLFLHIGMPKTGSTFLQDHIFPKLDHLHVRAVPHTALFNERGDKAIERRLMGCALRRAASIWSAAGDQMFEELLGNRMDWLKKPRDLLISDEAIGRAARRPGTLAIHLAALAEHARKWGFQKVKVLMVIRRQDTWLASHYAQISNRVTAANQGGFEQMVARTLDPRIDRCGFGMVIDYAALQAAILRELGNASLTVLPHEAMRADKGATLRNILIWLRTPSEMVEALTQHAEGSRANVRQAETGVWALRPYQLGKINAPSWAMPGRGKTIRLTSTLSAAILESYSAGNALLARSIPADLQKWGYVPSGTAPRPVLEGIAS